MEVQILKDKYGSKIAEIRDDGNVQSIYNKGGSKLGEYRRSYNATYDKGGSKIGEGNLLTTLI